MSTKDTLEHLAKNTWLAGLGSIDSSKDALSKSIETAQEKSNSLYNELVTRGEEIQSKFNHKKDALQAKGKNLLGMGSNKAHEATLADLNTKVDHLTTAVVALIEKRNAAAEKAKKPAPRAAAKPKTVTKEAPKAAAQRKVTEKAAPTKAAPAKAKVAPKTEPKATSTTKVADKK
jgi:hypothetical protein